MNCDWCFFDDVPNGLRGLCGTKWTKNGVKMKKRRTEKTVRRSFIYMEKASKIAVKQKQWLSSQDCRWYTNGLEVALQPLLRYPKYGGVTPYFDRCAILGTLHLPPAALGDEARHARASDKFCLTKKEQSPFWWLFLFGRGRRTWSRLPARSVLLHFVQRSPPETRTPQHAPRASESKSFYSMPKQKRSPFGNRFRFGRGRRTWTLGTRFWRPLLYQLSYTPILNSSLRKSLWYYTYIASFCQQ